MVFSPLAYPGYNWMAQAVSDLSASNAPSLRLWNQLSSLYNVCTLVCAMMVCVGIQGMKTRLLRVGIYLFTVMEWVSAVGFGMFPLSDSGYAGTFQDKMHIFSTVIVVLLSIVSLIIIIIAGARGQELPFLWSFRSNCAWNDDGRSHGDEHCSERLFWNRGEIQCICGNRI